MTIFCLLLQAHTYGHCVIVFISDRFQHQKELETRGQISTNGGKKHQQENRVNIIYKDCDA